MPVGAKISEKLSNSDTYRFYNVNVERTASLVLPLHVLGVVAGLLPLPQFPVFQPLPKGKQRPVTHRLVALVVVAAKVVHRNN